MRIGLAGVYRGRRNRTDVDAGGRASRGQDEADADACRPRAAFCRSLDT